MPVDALVDASGVAPGGHVHLVPERGEPLCDGLDVNGTAKRAGDDLIRRHVENPHQRTSTRM
jgi:hypothetical protein